jgi:hypothetical protein
MGKLKNGETGEWGKLKNGKTEEQENRRMGKLKNGKFSGCARIIKNKKFTSHQRSAKCCRKHSGCSPAEAHIMEYVESPVVQTSVQSLPVISDETRSNPTLSCTL